MTVFADLPGIISDVLADADLGFATITLTHVTQGAYDPSTGAATTTTSTETLNAVVEDYKGFDLLTNTLIQAGDKKITIAAADAASAPKPTDTVTAAGVTYAVVSVATVKPGSAAVIYEMQCRKA